MALIVDLNELLFYASTGHSNSDDSAFVGIFILHESPNSLRRLSRSINDFFLEDRHINDCFWHWHELDFLDDLIELLIGEWQITWEFLGGDVNKCRNDGFANLFIVYDTVVELWLLKLLKDKVAWMLKHTVLQLSQLIFVEFWQLFKAKFE